MARVNGAARTASLVAAGGDFAAYAAYQAAVSLVSTRFGVPVDSLERRDGVYRHGAPPKRDCAGDVARVLRARRIAIYLAVIAFDRSGCSISRAARITRQGVYKALRAIEDLRDDAQFDSTLRTLEQELAA